MRSHSFAGFVALGLLALASSRLEAVINVVTSTEDLAALTREVGGDKVKVDALGKGYQDPHFVEAKPSFILKLNKADLLVVVPWATCTLSAIPTTGSTPTMVAG
jgi:ABC-type Zn uptake system ZnuABC Zn-binding protein ZnuA